MTDQGGNDFSFENFKLHRDYMRHRAIDLAKENNLPMVILTDLQAGNGNIIENSKPTHPINLFTEYPDINFVLYQGSYLYC